MKRILVLSVLAASTLSVFAGEVTITLPPETATFKAAPGVEVAMANCLVCHSTEYISSQPPMARPFWEATIKKMREKYAAPVPDNAVTALADYLVANYGAAPK